VARQVLTARPGREPDLGPFRGVPDWMWMQLLEWLKDQLRPGTKDEDTATLHRVIARLRISTVGWTSKTGAWTPIWAWIHDDHEGERLLDVVNLVIQLRPSDFATVDELLSDGGSAYAATSRGVEDRVDGAAQAAFEAAIQPRDQASEDLSEAWSKAYGRDPDASDAWDHANKAVEAVLRGIISPENTKATLGTLIRDLRNGGHNFEFVLTSDSGGVPTCSQCCN
jgi:hypothetical protein